MHSRAEAGKGGGGGRGEGGGKRGGRGEEGSGGGRGEGGGKRERGNGKRRRTGTSQPTTVAVLCKFTTSALARGTDTQKPPNRTGATTEVRRFLVKIFKADGVALVKGDEKLPNKACLTVGITSEFYTIHGDFSSRGKRTVFLKFSFFG